MTEIVLYPDAILEEEVPHFDFDNPETDPIALAHTLAEALLKESALGLAANQLGLRHRAFIIKSDPMLCCFNPKVVNAGEEQVVLPEGCLSFPGDYVKVRRPRRIKVRYTRPNGEVVTEKLDGMTSRIFQHELDHLNGITMVDRASLLERERYRKRIKQERRKAKNVRGE